jgi:predicted nucleic acid-binding protein
MILVDANLLAYAHVRSMPKHLAAKTWLDGEINRGVRISFRMPTSQRWLSNTA